MEEFLFLFRGEEPRGKLSPEQIQQRIMRWRAWLQELSRGGHFKAGQPLAEAGRVVAGRERLVSDGPFAEAKELVAGYFVVVAADLTEATELAKGCPVLEEGGSVEVRPVWTVPE